MHEHCDGIYHYHTICCLKAVEKEVDGQCDKLAIDCCKYCQLSSTNN